MRWRYPRSSGHSRVQFWTYEHARGSLELADGDHAEAARRLKSALRLWLRLDAPYDGGLARTLLAEAHFACATATAVCWSNRIAVLHA
jgi:hypothetical protein